MPPNVGAQVKVVRRGEVGNGFNADGEYLGKNNRNIHHVKTRYPTGGQTISLFAANAYNIIENQDAPASGSTGGARRTRRTRRIRRARRYSRRR